MIRMAVVLALYSGGRLGCVWRLAVHEDSLVQAVLLMDCQQLIVDSRASNGLLKSDDASQFVDGFEFSKSPRNDGKRRRIRPPWQGPDG